MAKLRGKMSPTSKTGQLLQFETQYYQTLEKNDLSQVKNGLTSGQIWSNFGAKRVQLQKPDKWLQAIAGKITKKQHCSYVVVGDVGLGISLLEVDNNIRLEEVYFSIRKIIHLSQNPPNSREFGIVLSSLQCCLYTFGTIPQRGLHE